jgi:pyruvate dehydrogenase E1 component alpha subunit
MASIYKFPVIYVCENNYYGISGCAKDTMNICDISVRADSYGIPGVSVNGNDVLGVYEAAKAAVTRGRKGEGPTLIECKTWRHRGHWEGDPDNYRDKKQCDDWLTRDPISCFESELISKKIATEEELEDIQKELDIKLDEAVEFAEKSPAPEPKDLYDDVYA